MTGIGVDIGNAVNAIRSGKFAALGGREVHGWLTFTPAERGRFRALFALIQREARSMRVTAAAARPLSIGVFGPPGCGKSTAVKKLCAGTGLHTFNLTQVRDPAALAEELRTRVLAARKAGQVLYAFFDEFDAPLAGARWGWLPWLLAPMEDGEFLAPGDPRPVLLGPAVFFFAGGTAETLDEFSRPTDYAAFRAAKGPDFVSRLRDFIDIPGLNADGRRERLARRAAALSRECQGRRIHRGLLAAFLQAGRYRHGGRSLRTVVQRTFAKAKKTRAERKHLPDPAALALHVDRGPLDPTTVGGAIALSGGGRARLPRGFKAAWQAVARCLFQDGATIAYGGNASGGLTEVLKAAAASLPMALTTDPDKEPPRVHSFPPDRAPQPGDGTVDADGVMVERPVHGVSPEERSSWDPPIASVISLFRMRLQVTEASVARVAMLGKASGYSGRFPGITEEVMLSLCAQQPVYVIGGFGGAARDIGMLLGLGRPWRGSNLESFKAPSDAGRERLPVGYQDQLRPPPWLDLPITMPELVEFLKQHALDGDRWPDNGLTASENRQLFASVKPGEIAGFVQMGLRRRFAEKRA